MIPDFRIQDVRTPLGRIALGGQLLEHYGTPLVRDWQVRDTYSLACIRRGKGLYYDTLGHFQKVETGDVICTFPGIGHRYGPERNETWDECFVIFDGPFFDLCRTNGLLRPAMPIIRLEAGAEPWCSAILDAIEALQAVPSVGRFLHLATAILEPFGSTDGIGKRFGPSWLPLALSRLDRLEEKLEIEVIAQEIGIAGRTLQRQFHRAMGLSPQQYRDERRLRVALELLTHVPGIKLRTVAQRVGFVDEFYFSRWFKRKVGVAPHQWRMNE